MSRIIFVPQYPTPMRYQEFWFKEFAYNLTNPGDEIVILGGKDYIKTEFLRGPDDMFSPVEKSIRWELSQIVEFMDLELKDDDILFLADLSFPGFFANALYHKKPKRCFAFCHATSLNNLDYFELVRNSKYPVEYAQAKLFDKVFVGSQYHKDKLQWSNIEVTYLPTPPFKVFKEEKIYDIISVARPTKQKVDYDIEEKVEKEFGKIIRKECNTWKEYYKFLSSAKILLISSKEDTFNYTILESIINNTIVLAPNKLCFPELLSKEYLYNNFIDLKKKLNKYLYGNTYKIPKLKCQDMVDNFFSNIIKTF